MKLSPPAARRLRKVTEIVTYIAVVVGIGAVLLALAFTLLAASR